jgi:hypothetical protein
MVALSKLQRRDLVAGVSAFRMLFNDGKGKLLRRTVFVLLLLLLSLLRLLLILPLREADDLPEVEPE